MIVTAILTLAIAGVVAAVVALRPCSTTQPIVVTSTGFSGFSSSSVSITVTTSWPAMPPTGTAVPRPEPARPSVPERLIWDSAAREPILIRIDDDAVEDLVGRTRGEGDELHIDAYDGNTLARIWRVGPFGTYGEGYGATHFAVARGRIVVTDHRATAHIYDLHTGADAGTVPLSDRADDACSAPGDSAEVWLGLRDRRDLIVDLSTGTTRQARRPAWCREHRGGGRACESQRYFAECSRRSVRLDGFASGYVLSEGANAVALGVRSPGTRTPTAVGLAGGSRERWRLVLPADPMSGGEGDPNPADMRDGRLYARYGPRDGPRLVAIDAATGARIWDVAIPSGRAGRPPIMSRELAVGSTRLAIVHFGELDLFDAATGRHVGSVGR